MRNSKQLVTLVESIKDETYKIITRQQNKLTAEFKNKIKAIIEERVMRGELTTNHINWSCGDCVLEVLNMVIVPYMEGSKYKALKLSVEENEATIAHLKMLPDAFITIKDVNNGISFELDDIESKGELTEVIVSIDGDTKSLQEYILSEDFKEVSKSLRAMKLTDEEMNDKIRGAIKIEKSEVVKGKTSVLIEVDKDKIKDIASTNPPAPVKKSRARNK